MKEKPTGLFIALAIVLIVSGSLQAHHGLSAYDMTSARSLKGTITSFELANPHAQIAFDVKDDAGNVEHWTVESGPAIRAMKEAGWHADSLKPGDEVTIFFHPSKRAVNVGVLIKVVFADGSVLPLKTSGDKPEPNN
jgi:hypothetical protein